MKNEKKGLWIQNGNILHDKFNECKCEFTSNPSESALTPESPRLTAIHWSIKK